MYKRSGAYYYVFRNKWTRLSANLGEAKAMWAEIEGVPDPRGHGSINALIARYLEEITPTKAKTTHRNDEAAAELLKAFFGHMLPEAVRPMHVAQYLRSRADSGAPVAGNREKALLSHVFTMGMEWGIVDFNPCKGVRRNPEKPRERYVKDAEFKKVWEVGNQTVRDAMDLAYLTAQRIGDVLTMQPSDDRGNVLMVKQNKTGARVAITVTPALRAVLDRCRARGSIKGLTLLHTRHGQPYTVSGFSSMFTRPRNKLVAEGKIEHFTFHDLRGKALTDLKRAGVPKDEIQALAGHATGAQTEAYFKAREYTPATALDRAIC